MKKIGIEMNERKGEFLVGLALALRASSLLFGKIAMRSMGPFLTIAIRFTIAFIIIAIIFRKSITKVDARTLFHCALIGATFFLAMLFEMMGLKTTASSVTAFLEGTDFEDVIRTAVSLGGDCDTLTCIAGSIAEAFYGVPGELKGKCREYLTEDLLGILDRFDARRAAAEREA
jgi:uncharacterized membrane protein